MPEYLAQLDHEEGNALQVVAGADMAEQLGNCVIVEAFNSTEEPQGTGNYWWDVRVSVKSRADQQEPMENKVAEHERRCEAILGGLKRDDLHGFLSLAIEDFYVYDGMEDLGADPAVRGRSFVDSHVWRIYCCGSDLTEE